MAKTMSHLIQRCHALLFSSGMGLCLSLLPGCEPLLSLLLSMLCCLQGCLCLRHLVLWK